MSAVTTHHDDHAHDDTHAHELPYGQQLRANRLGLWLFLFSEVFLFVGLFAARFYLWRDASGVVRPELGPGSRSDCNLGFAHQQLFYGAC